MVEQRIRVEPSSTGKIVAWGALALTAVAILGGGISFAVTVNSRIGHVDERVVSLVEEITTLEGKISDLTLAFANLNLYIGDNLGAHRGEHGRIEAAADQIEAAERRIEARLLELNHRTKADEEE